MNNDSNFQLWKKECLLNDEELERYADILPLIDVDILDCFENLPAERRMNVYNGFIKNKGTPMELLLVEMLMMLPEKKRMRWLFKRRQKRYGL